MPPWACPIIFVKKASLCASSCPGSLRKVSYKTGGKYCCFKYQEFILACRHHNLFPAQKMCYKVLHFVSSALVSTALLSFSCSAPCWLLLHNSYQLDSCIKSVEFSLLASLRTHSLPSPGYFRYLSLLCSWDYLHFLNQLRLASNPWEVKQLRKFCMKHRTLSRSHACLISCSYID